MRKTKTQRIIEYVQSHPGVTRIQVARAIGEWPYIGGEDPTSGIMVKLEQKRVLRRKTGIGPRGGYGYWVK